MPVKGKHQIFILLCLHFTSVQSDFERVCDSRTELRGSDPNGICGRMIPEMLHLLCGGHYYVPSKRDVSSLSHKQDSNLGKLLGVLKIWIYWTIMKPMNDSIKNSKTRLSNDWYNNRLCTLLEFTLISLISKIQKLTLTTTDTIIDYVSCFNLHKWHENLTCR